MGIQKKKPLKVAIGDMIKSRLADAGFDVRRNPFVDPVRQQVSLMNRAGIAAPMVFDVGAHIGQTAQAYREVFPQAVIHAFEPFPDSMAQLHKRVGNQSDTHCHALALSNNSAPQTFFVNEAEATNSLKPKSDEADEHWGAGKFLSSHEIQIQCDTLDAFCSARQINQVDILKIDVQGAEYEVLEGAHDMLARQAIQLIQFECILAQTYAGQRPLHEYLALMQGYGYELLDFYQPLRRNGRLLQTDLMFASARIRAS